MRNKNILFVIVLLVFPISNNLSQSLTHSLLVSRKSEKTVFFDAVGDQKEMVNFQEDTLKEIPDSTVTFLDFEIPINIRRSMDGDNGQKGIPIGFGIGIPLGQDYYFYPEYKNSINYYPKLFSTKTSDDEVVISIGRLYGKNKFRVFPKIGFTAYRQSVLIFYFALLLNFGVDFRYNVNEYSAIFGGLVLTASPSWESKYVGKILKIGFSTNL